MLKRVGLALIAVIGLLVAIVLIRGLTFRSPQVDVPPVSDIVIDTDGAAGRLAGALRYRTISYQDSADMDGDEFRRFHAYLDSAFPRVHALLERETVNEYSLLYRWEGADPSMDPIVLMAHMDAVPVEPGTERDWSRDPFSGDIVDGYVWGRGAMDDKGSLIAIMEAAEMLLDQGFQPQRTVYFAFGHDEEVGGQLGAVAIAAQLADRSVLPAFVVDEGGVLADALIPNIDQSVALVGIAEKGYLTIELTATSGGGHSSMPPPRTTIGVLSTAIDRLQRRPMPGGIRGPTEIMFDYVGPELPFLSRTAVANRWLLGWLVEAEFGRSPEGRSLLGTTMAPTIFEAGVKENVLPSSARAVVNIRILPGDSSASVLAHVRRTIRNPAIEVRTIGFVSEPSPVSDVESLGFRTVERTIRELHPDALVVPWLVVGGTDSRHFARLTSQIIRFSGARVGPDDLRRVHGTDERVGVEVYADMVRFYLQLLRNAAGS